jgi:hypothetical protein
MASVTCPQGSISHTPGTNPHNSPLTNLPLPGTNYALPGTNYANYVPRYQLRQLRPQVPITPIPLIPPPLSQVPIPTYEQKIRN